MPQRFSHTLSADEPHSHKEDGQGSLAVYVGHTCIYVVVHQAQLQAAFLAGDAIVYCSTGTRSALGLTWGKQRCAYAGHT